MNDQTSETVHPRDANGTGAPPKRKRGAYCGDSCRALNRRRARSDDGYGLAKWHRESVGVDVRELRAESVRLKLGDVRFGRVLAARQGLCIGCATAIPQRWPDLSRTAAALEEYDRTWPDREEKWNDTQTQNDVRACVAMDNAARMKVREAFALDTADRNSPENAKLASIDTLRQWVAKWRAQEVADAARS